MPYLFDHLDSVDEVLALTPLGLITDIDGTISEIAPSPEEARVSSACRDSLATLTGQLELVAAISGRPAQQARDMVGIEGMVYVGNHGLERLTKGTIEFVPGVEGYRDKVAQALGELNELLSLDGIALENKGLALSIHYRQCLDGEGARRHILERISTAAIAREFSIIEGRMVVELRPPLKANKGDAVLTLIERHRLQGGVYLGDDISDLDAFAAIHGRARGSSFRGLALGVIDEETSPLVEKEADFTLHRVGDVERFLKWVTEIVAVPRH
jgi:trehalose 6-phosphate phosphatase